MSFPTPQSPKPSTVSHNPAKGPADGPAYILRRLTLAKEGAHYIFTYAPGCELDLLSFLVHTVQEGNWGLDWYDAVVLSHQMGQNMTRELEQMVAKTGEGHG